MSEHHLSTTSEHQYSSQGRDAIKKLEEKVHSVFSQVQKAEIWKTLTGPETSDARVRAIIREVFYSIYSYQRHTTEAGFLMISRLPKSEHKLLSALTHHKLDEAEHGEWAKRDFLLLGGEEYRLTLPPSPSTFAVASIWWRMALVEDPFGYLGAEYLFEYLTVLAAVPVVELFKSRKLGREGFGFIIDHATEDVKHTNLLRHLVGDTVTRYPETITAMMRCFDYFAHVYPVPVWSEAFEKTR